VKECFKALSMDRLKSYEILCPSKVEADFVRSFKDTCMPEVLDRYKMKGAEIQYIIS
jgi:hypothetical protein